MEENNQAVDANPKDFKLASDNNDITAENNTNSNRIDDSGLDTSKRKKKLSKIRNEVNIKTKPKFIGKNSN
jgi:hypothetical protein